MGHGPLEFIRTLAGFYPDLICEIKSKGSDPPHVTSMACDSPHDPRGVKPLNFISQEFWVGPVDFIVGRLGLFIMLEVWYLRIYISNMYVFQIHNMAKIF